MATLTYNKFTDNGGKTNLWRTEIRGENKIIFFIDGISLSLLKNDHNDINFDEMSDEKLKELGSGNHYFKWLVHDFFPCGKEEVI